MNTDHDLEHLNRAQLAERFEDEDGPELAQYLIAEMDEERIEGTVGALAGTHARLTNLAAGCLHLANLLRSRTRAR